MVLRWATAAGFALFSCAAYSADERSIVLKDAPDAVLTTMRCSICHSLDYIQMNSVFLKSAGWETEVHKMIKVMGAPISEEESAKIIAYLTRYYGAQ
jgi:hypothetical protein